MISETTLAEHALLAYETPNIVVDNAAALVSVVDKTTLISVAGTNDYKDGFADLKAIPWKPKELGFWTHSGFWTHTKKLIKPIMREIYLNGDDKPYPVAFSGHSLGGAACYNLASYLVLRGLCVANLTTYGTPRSTFEEGNKITCDIPGDRYVREGDTIAAIPTILPWSHDREATMLQGADGVIDHFMAGYLSQISKLQE